MSFKLDPEQCKDIRFMQTLEVIVDGNKIVHQSHKVIHLPTHRMSDRMLTTYGSVMCREFYDVMLDWLTDMFVQIVSE